VIHQARENAGLIADFMQVALALADRRGGNLSDHGQHRRIHPIGREQRCARVEKPWAWHHRIGMRFAGRESCAERHIARTLFVSRVDDTQKFSGAVKGVEQMVVVDTGKRVNGVEPVADESRNGGLGRGHFHGCRLCLLFAGRL
jgi:hypothetical protein